MTQQALAEFDAKLAANGGAGFTFSSLVPAPSAATNDYAALNIGQLKYLAKPFYDRLAALGAYGNNSTLSLEPK